MCKAAKEWVIRLRDLKPWRKTIPKETSSGQSRKALCSQFEAKTGFLRGFEHPGTRPVCTAKVGYFGCKRATRSPWVSLPWRVVDVFS